MLEFLVSPKNFFLVSLLFGSPLILVALIALAVYFREKLTSIWQRIIFSFMIVVLMLTIWGVYIEANLITITNQKITLGFKSRIAVISDIHLGQWKNQDYLEKVVTKINEQPNVDAVLIPGDWTYWPDIDKLNQMFTPLSKLKYPVFGVLGNHDVEQPGPKLREQLKKALEKNKVVLLNNQLLSQKDTGLKFDIAGIGDNTGSEDDVNILKSQTGSKTIAITHSPETILKYNTLERKNQPTLTITGHTHCGQVRIPLIYKLALPVENKNFDKGLYANSSFDNSLMGQLWISCGVGESGVPMRLFNPPSIDIIEIE